MSVLLWTWRPKKQFKVEHADLIASVTESNGPCEPHHDNRPPGNQQLMRLWIDLPTRRLGIRSADFKASLRSNGPIARGLQAAKSILVMDGGWCCSSTGPLSLIFASSEFSSAPTNIPKPVQYSQVIRAIAAPKVP